MPHGTQSLRSAIQATYIGVELTSDLSWGPHVKRSPNKANQTLGF